jgi:hypothetical protein
MKASLLSHQFAGRKLDSVDPKPNGDDLPQKNIRRLM